MDPSNAIVLSPLVLVGRLILGGFLLPSALGKFRDLAGFIQGTIEYQILPERTVRPFAALLPWAELALALMLLLGVALPLAGAATALLLICFIVAVAINLRRGRQIACNCHGVAGTKLISWGTVARNLLLVLLTLPLLSADMGGWSTRWRADLTLLSTPAGLIPIVLLLAFGFIIIPLIEWTVDLQMRAAQLRKRLR